MGRNALAVGFIVLLAGDVAGIVLGAGCAQLAGIDDTTGEGLPGNTIAVQRMSIGKSVDLAPLDLTGLTANYLVDKNGQAKDFDRIAATNAGGGTWVTKLRTPAPVIFTLPDAPTAPRLYAFPNATLSILYSQLEHQNRAPAPPGAMLTVTAHLDAATTAADSFQIYTVGSWTSHPLPVAMAGEMDLQLMYAFDTSTSQSGRAQLDRITAAQDVFLVLRYTGAALTGVAEALPFDQNGDDKVMVTMTPVAPDRTLDVTVSAEIAKRYFTVRPAVGMPTMGWSLVAAPGASYASNSGPVLHSGSLMASDVGVNVMYGNPFAGSPHNWRTLLTLYTYGTRTYHPSTDVAVTLYAGMNQFVEPSAGMKLNLDAGLPESILFNKQPLSTDGQTVPKPTAFVEIAINANPAANTLFGLQLYDLLPSTDGKQLDYHFVFEALSTSALFNLPPEIFQTGHSYTLRALTTAGGYPAIGTGNLVTRQLPLSQSFLDSGVFTVMAVTP